MYGLSRPEKPLSRLAEEERIARARGESERGGAREGKIEGGQALPLSPSSSSSSSSRGTMPEQRVQTLGETMRAAPIRAARLAPGHLLFFTAIANGIPPRRRRRRRPYSLAQYNGDLRPASSSEGAAVAV